MVTTVIIRNYYKIESRNWDCVIHLALMPTTLTSQILGVNVCFKPSIPIFIYVALRQESLSTPVTGFNQSGFVDAINLEPTRTHWRIHRQHQLYTILTKGIVQNRMETFYEGYC